MSELFFEYSNKQVTPFGGMLLIRRFLERTGINEFLSSRPELPSPGSNAGYEALHILQAFWVSIWLGANRLPIQPSYGAIVFCKRYLGGSDVQATTPMFVFSKSLI